MMRRRPALARQRGVAVITALLLTTLAITIVASLFWQQQVQVRSIENQRLQLQKQWILRGALDWASLILRADANTSGPDHLGEPWAVPLAETRLDQYVENGRADAEASDAALSGSIIDAQSRFNLTNLATNGQPNPEEIQVYQQLLSELRLNPGLAKVTAETIAASQPVAPLPPTGNPAQAPVAQGPTNSSGPRPMKIEYLDDLLAVPGYSVEILEKLRNFVTVLPLATKINANTAPKEVLAAKLATLATLSASDAAVLVASRDSAYFKDESDIPLRLGKVGSINNGTFAIATSYFLVNGKVRLNRAGLEVQALIRRDGGTTRIIWIREN